MNKVALAASAAASLLGASGAVHASTVGTSPVNVHNSVTLSGFAVQNANTTGTGTLDSASGLTINSSGIETVTTSAGQQTLTVSETDIFSGTISGNTFTASGGTTEITACTGGSFCGPAGVGKTKKWTTATGTLSLTAGGTGLITAVAHPSGTNQTATFALTSFSVAAVPLPPAAWLLGSGLLGLVGTARRRRKA